MYYAYMAWLTILMRRNAKHTSVWNSAYDYYFTLLQGRYAAYYTQCGRELDLDWYN